MRKLAIASCAFLCWFTIALPALGGTFNAQGRFVGRVNPQLAALVAANPGGGPALASAIEALIVANPAAADDAVYLARNSSNPDVKKAIGIGLAGALAILTHGGDLGGASRIRQALLFADAITLAAYSYANAQAQLGQGGSTTTFGETGAGGPSCHNVSPTRPGC